MASYEVDAYGARAKVREVGLVVLFFFLTLGFLIYPQVWYYRINRELRDFGVAYKDEELAKTRPGLSVLATTLGALLIIPAVVSWWRTTGRIRRAQEITNTDQTNGWVIFALYIGGIFLTPISLGIPAYVQSGLNAMWEKYPRVEGDAQTAAISPTEAPALDADSDDAALQKNRLARED